MKWRYVMMKRIKRRIIGLLVVVLSTLFEHEANSQVVTASAKNPVASTSKSSAVRPPAADRTPVFPYGGVYFRKSNPPREDWGKDYKTAADLGANLFRHWFMWAVIEVAPGKYDWSDYDRQMDLAAKNGIKTIIGEISNVAPEWMGEIYPKGREVNSTNDVSYPTMGGSSATSSINMCLDNEDVLRAAEKFQTALIERYRDHPSMLGYDLWNEMHFSECRCEATQEKFREWLKAKYSSLEELGKAWHRYSFAKWEFVRPPSSRSGGYADAMDWVEFRNDNKSRLLHRRVELFRKLDKKNLITGHGLARSLEQHPSTQNEWRDAAEFDVFGFTWV
ncbi:MAG: beta-galactosidase, partial [Segetibacter sp.]